MHQVRRFTLWMLLSFTFGGFLFYAGIVVPTGTSVLGTTTQGFVTRHVTRALNVSVLVTVAALCWDIYVQRIRRKRWATRSLTGAVAWIAITCGILWFLHGKLNAQLSDDEFAVLDGTQFYAMHRIYLWVSTLQWLSSLIVFWVLASEESSRTNTS